MSSTTANAAVAAVAAAKECPGLTNFKELPFDYLMVLAKEYYEEDPSLLEITVSGVFNDTNPGTIEHKLAETLYYRKGALLLKEEHFNSLTRLQMEHECIVRGLFTREEVTQCRSIELQVRLRVDARSTKTFALDEDTAEVPQSSRDSGYQSGRTVEESSAAYEADDEASSMSETEKDEKKAIYVNVWKPKLGRFVTFRY